MGITSTAANTSLTITSYFEGWLSGNSDRQYLSYGYLQWNFGQGTLQPLFNRLFSEFPQIAESILPNGGSDLQLALKLRTERGWALGIQINNVIQEPWKSALRELYQTFEFIQIMDDASQWYKNRAIGMCSAFGLKTVRAYALAFDLAVQNGGLDYYEMTETEYLDKLQSWVNVAVSKTTGTINGSNELCKQDVNDRKMAIVTGGSYGTKGWPLGLQITDESTFETDWVDWKTILTTISENANDWIAGIVAITNLIESNNDSGSLKIFQFIPALIEKIFNKRTGISSDWEFIISTVLTNPAEWIVGIDTIEAMAEAQGNIGALEIFKYVKSLLVKLYNWEV